ncbi:hypothetical protein CKJ54_20410 [Mycobacterium marseillense]|uniref:GAF domain-containing protein n=2 Tax=Mycobacterium marseillense TaxID=701042 RepID=A0AAC9YMG8_9MYCO|nr:hypothetical protein CKJ54_20410 [Mycobacterium marseillense]
MALERGAYFGRPEESIRRFRPGNEIFDQTMNNQRRFVRAIPEDVQREEQLNYKTYLTHPVSSGDGARVHGALTVDCPNVGDIDPTIDVPLVAVLSDLIAATYDCEQTQPHRYS